MLKTILGCMKDERETAYKSRVITINSDCKRAVFNEMLWERGIDSYFNPRAMHTNRVTSLNAPKAYISIWYCYINQHLSIVYAS